MHAEVGLVLERFDERNQFQNKALVLVERTDLDLQIVEKRLEILLPAFRLVVPEFVIFFGVLFVHKLGKYYLHDSKEAGLDHLTGEKHRSKVEPFSIRLVKFATNMV